MPAKPAWLLRVPEIIEEVRCLQGPVVDRAMLERMFGVRRRRAIDLMQRVGGYQCGRTYLVNREDILDWLERVKAEPSFQSEETRKRKLTGQLNELHRHRAASRITIPVLRDGLTRLPCLPEGITINPGTLTVLFATTEELLARLYAFSQLVADDFDAFCDMLQDMPPRGTKPIAY
jgi:hypothetical protein